MFNYHKSLASYQARWMPMSGRINEIMNSPEMFSNRGLSYAHNNAIFQSLYMPHPHIKSSSGCFNATPVNYSAGMEQYINYDAVHYPGKQF